MKKKNYWPRSHSKGSSSLGTRESSHDQEHIPVLLKEVIEHLQIKEDGIYIDATFGRGGHSREILKKLGPSGKLLVIDKDPDAIKIARTIRDGRLYARQGSSIFLQKWLEELGLVGKVDGILLDLGVSSPQLDDPQRGFSFLREGPLDMRMDPNQKLDAATWLNNAEQHEIAKVIKEYGEERYSKRIAGAIVKQREETTISTTTQLASLIKIAIPRAEKHKHPATRTFQAIRIFINNELLDLENTLEQCLNGLAIGGRLLAISFHSLEDRIVKHFMKKYIKGKRLPIEIPVTNEQLNIRFKQIGKPIKPTNIEIKNNPRARSAILRVAEKIA